MMGKFEFVEVTPPTTRIKVIGVGGGGSNAVDNMIDMGLTGVEFCNINTDTQALSLSKCPNKLHIGTENTGGMGCGGDPALGEKAALACKEQIAEVLKDSDMVFIAAGLGGGTGTGAAPVIAETAKNLGILTVAIVTKPFAFEGPQRSARAEQGLAKISEFVDTKIVILNDKLLEAVGAKTPLTDAFALVNRVLAEGVSAISDLITVPGEINVDFMDVRAIMGETGGAVMGVGIGKGENRSIEAVKKACASPLQEKIVIDGAKGVLISITGSPDVTLQEINTATTTVYESADENANIIFGLVIDPSLKDEMRVTIIATGFPDETRRYPAPHHREKLVSPKTDIDLDTKLKSMFNGADGGREAVAEESTPAYRPPVQPTRPVMPQTVAEPAFQPRINRQSPPSATPAAQPRWSVPQAEEQPVQSPAASLPAVEEPAKEPSVDLNEPAYNRRRRTLFE
ncbi:MAG TPA: cell division protein FtsZ [Candidatus Sumerlaeota bacterium]|nr:cell division protein FtsZ [Candidatus Sumerlaeota bacterium]